MSLTFGRQQTNPEDHLTVHIPGKKMCRPCILRSFYSSFVKILNGTRPYVGWWLHVFRWLDKKNQECQKTLGRRWSAKEDRERPLDGVGHEKSCEPLLSLDSKKNDLKSARLSIQRKQLWRFYALRWLDKKFRNVLVPCTATKKILKTSWLSISQGKNCVGHVPFDPFILHS